jgi:hypothetical protein
MARISSESWSAQRRITAQRVAAILYGVIGIMTAELSVQEGEFGYAESVLGALLVGLAMMVTRIFIEVVKKETEIGAHLPLRKSGAIVRDSALVMLFPAVAALVVMIAALITAKWSLVLNLLLYLGMATVFVVGFLSSYVLDRAIWLALVRGAGWLLLSLVLVVAKKLA